MRRIVKLTLDPQNPYVGILLRYERLPELCYGCGLFGHQLKECSQYCENIGNLELKLPYGSSLRAGDEKVKLPPVEVIIHRIHHNQHIQDKPYEENSIMLLDSIGQKRGFPQENEEVFPEIAMEASQYRIKQKNKRRFLKSTSPQSDINQINNATVISSNSLAVVEL